MAQQLHCWQPYAYHEAGHAVAHWHHRRAFRYVTMRPRERAYGGLTRGYGRPMQDRAGRIAAMHIAAAGDIAQRRYLPFYEPETLIDHLTEVGILNELTGRSYGRKFGAVEVINIVDNI